MKAITLLLLLALCVGGCTSPTAPAPAPTQPQNGLLIMGQDGGPVVIRT